MMSKPTVSLLAVAGVLFLAEALGAEPSQAELQAQTRISQEQATRAALARVPHGKVKSAELEREHGKLVWSFDLARGDKNGMTEIQVDAITGKILSQKYESAAQEASEANEEAQQK
jgi:uncharacterized membrane protein YkoI